MICWKADH